MAPAESSLAVLLQFKSLLSSDWHHSCWVDWRKYRTLRIDHAGRRPRLMTQVVVAGAQDSAAAQAQNQISRCLNVDPRRLTYRDFLRQTMASPKLARAVATGLGASVLSPPHDCGNEHTPLRIPHHGLKPDFFFNPSNSSSLNIALTHLIIVCSRQQLGPERICAQRARPGRKHQQLPHTRADCYH